MRHAITSEQDATIREQRPAHTHTHTQKAHHAHQQSPQRKLRDHSDAAPSSPHLVLSLCAHVCSLSDILMMFPNV